MYVPIHNLIHSLCLNLSCSDENTLLALAQEIDLYMLDKVKELTSLMRVLFSFSL